MKDSQLVRVGDMNGLKYIKVNNERFSTHGKCCVGRR